ncbi:hypothetical protein [Rubrobacter aplysinae]|uniref:hypothetical protein n=1 Tax=Rubrobacter aplysinae TaxID=909625 RepID=UPI00064B939D|nr:hypothetical protein [Rubrobacter aplysinae]
MAIWQYPNSTGALAFVVVGGEKLASGRDRAMISFRADGSERMDVYRLRGHDETAEPVLEDVPADGGPVEEKCIWIAEG